MKWLASYLVEGMQGIIEENYLYIIERKGRLWIYTPLDEPDIPIIGIYRTHLDARVCDILRNHWGKSNVFVSVRKVASAVLEDKNAR